MRVLIKSPKGNFNLVEIKNAEINADNNLKLKRDHGDEKWVQIHIGNNTDAYRALEALLIDGYVNLCAYSVSYHLI